MAEQIHVRTAEPADIPRIAELYRSWWDEIDGGPHSHPGPVGSGTPEEGHPDRVLGTIHWIDVDRDALAGLLERIFLVTEQEAGRVAGFVYAYESVVAQDRYRAFRDGGPYIEIVDLYVEADWRGEGLGTALLDAVFALGASKGIGQFHLVSDPRPELERFYGRHGFTTYTVYRYKGGNYESPPGHVTRP